MGIEGLISVAAMLALLAASTGQLPRMLVTVRVAQLHLIQDSLASKWGHALLLQQTK